MAYMAYSWKCLPCESALLGMREGLRTSEAKCRKFEPGRAVSGLCSFCEPDVRLHLGFKASAPSFRRILGKAKRQTLVAGKSHSPCPHCCHAHVFSVGPSQPSEEEEHSHFMDKKSEVPQSQETHLKTQGQEERVHGPHFSSRNLLAGFDTKAEPCLT